MANDLPERLAQRAGPNLGRDAIYRAGADTIAGLAEHAAAARRALDELDRAINDMNRARQHIATQLDAVAQRLVTLRRLETMAAKAPGSPGNETPTNPGRRNPPR